MALFAILGKTQINVSYFSDCSQHFKEFNRKLKIPQSKIESLQRAKSAIKQRVTNSFSKEKLDIRYRIQGSYKMGTLTRNMDDQYDIDLGVYLPRSSEFSAYQAQNRIVNCLKGHTNGKLERKSKCVRLHYSEGYHIDIPVYRFNEYDECLLGTNENEWIDSNPKLLTDWFENETKEKSQIRRLIRYFKAWSNNQKKKKGHKMPSGLAFTIWTVENYSPNHREDIAFYETACKIYNEVSSFFGVRCDMPVWPRDNVVKDLNPDQKERFIENLEELIQQGTNALESNSWVEAAEKWKDQMGPYFPEVH